MKLAVAVLRVAAALQCVGLFRTAFVDGTPLGTTLFMTLGWSEAAMLRVEYGVAWLGLLCGLSLLARPTRAAAAVVGTWFFIVAALTVLQGGSFGSDWAVLAHATRFLLPVTLFFTAMDLDPATLRRRVELVARWGTAVTFVAHGIEALEQNPVFIDYVITAFRRVGVEVPESSTRILLSVIGTQDLLLAGLIVARRWRWIAAYMAFWGAITAGSRIVHMGFGRWPATLLRAANVGLPLALALLWAPAADEERKSGEQEGPPA